MKKFYLFAILFIFSLGTKAQFTVSGLPIAYWDFENNGTRTTGETTVEAQINSGNTFDGKFGGATTALCSTAGNGLTYGAIAAGSAIVAGGWSTTTTFAATIGNYYGFTLNTTGFSGISYTVDLKPGSTTANYPVVGFAYSTDGGVNYTSLGTAAVTDNAWGSFSVALPAACDNIANLKIKIIGYFSNNSAGCATNGYLIMDNFVVLAQNIVANAGTKTSLNELNYYTSVSSGGTGSLYSRFGTFTVNSGATLNLGSQLNIGTSSTAGAITIASGGTLDCGSGGTQVISTGTSGLSTVTISSGASIIIRSVSGITTSPTAAGNIQTTTRTFNAGGKYTYTHTAGTAQVTGTGLPTNITGSLTINNSGGVTLTQATTVSGTGTLNITSGIFTTTTTNTISVTNTATTAVTGGSGTAFIGGPLNWTLPVSLVSSSLVYNFPVGGTSYLPYSLTTITTGATSPVLQVTAFNSSSGGSADGSTVVSISSAEYWQTKVISGNYSGASLSLGRVAALGTINAIGKGASTSSAATTYSSLAGAIGTLSSQNSINTSTQTGAIAATTSQFNVLGTVTPVITSLSPTSGCPGSTLVINGAGLAGATVANVTIGGTAVSSITSNTGTVLTVVTGAGTSGTVSVTTPAGTATSAGTFTFLSTPDASNFSASASSVCTGSGSVVTVNSSTLPSGTYTVTYNVSGTNTVSSTTASMIFTAGSPGTGTFTTANLSAAGAANVVNITSVQLSGGCTSNLSYSTASFTTSQTPVVSNFSASATTTCSGNGATVTVNSTTMASGTYTVTYDVSGTNTVSTTTASMIFTSGAPGSGTFTTAALSTPGASNVVNLTSIVSAAVPSCPASLSTSTAAFATATTPSGSDFNPAAASACVGSGSVVTVTSTSLASGTYTVTYNVSGTNTVSSTTASMIFTAGSPGSGTFTTSNLNTAGAANVVNITAIAFSASPTCTYTLSSSTAAFTTNATPTATNLTASAGASCLGSGATVTVNSTTLASGTYTVTYNVSGTNTVGSTTASMTFTAGAPGSGTFTTANLNSAGAANVVNITAIAFSATPACTIAKSASTAAFTTGGTATWTGGAGTTNWATAANWACNAVPVATDNVIIASAAFQPVISSAAVCTNITLNSGTTLTINNTLAVSGNWTNNSTAVAVSGSGTVTLSGGACTIGGTASTAFPNLTITGTVSQGINTTVTGNYIQTAGTYTVTPAGTAYTLTVSGTFTQSAGTFNVTGSSATAGATVTVSGATSISSVYMEPNSGNTASTVLFQVNNNVTFTGTGVSGLDWMAGGTSGTTYPITFGITGNFNWSGSGQPWTGGDGTALGFTFNGAGTTASPQTLTYSGTASGYASQYIVNSGTVVQLLTSISEGSSSIPYCHFIVNGTLDAGLFGISGGVNAGGASSGFFLNSGATLITKNTSGVTGTITDAKVSYNNAANYTFNGTTNQTANFSNTTMNDLTVSNTGTSPTNKVSLNAAPSVNGNLAVNIGVLDAAAFQIIGNATNIFSLAPNTTFRMSGLTTVNFPTLFTSAHCQFDVLSTTEYYGAGQTVSATPTYGNLWLSTSGNKTAVAGLTIAGNFLINSPATFLGGTSLVHTLYGNWQNDGNFTANSCKFIFTGPNSVTLSGTGLSPFYDFTLSKGSDTTTIVNVTGTGLASITNTPTFTSGKLRIQTGGAFTVVNNGFTITAASGIHVNGGTFSVNNLSIINNGLFRLTTGTANIGSASNNELKNATGSICAIEGGTYTGSSRLIATGGKYQQSGGTVTLCTVSNTSSTVGNFDISATSTLNISGGNLIFRLPNSAGTPFSTLEITSGAGTKSISGGTIQIGDGSTTAGQTFIINSPIAFNNLTINLTNTPSSKLSADLTVAGTLAMNGGNIDANGKTLYVSNSVATAISRSAGFVIGNLKRAVSALTTDYVWPVGITNNYTPATYKFAALTSGDINMIAMAGEHPQIGTSSIDPVHDVNAYWSVTGTAASTSYSGSYAYPTGLNDNVADAPNYINGKYSGTTWSNVPLNGTPSSTLLSFTGGSGFSDFVIGKCKTITNATVGPNQLVCDGGSVTLSGSAPTTPEVGTWSISAEPAGGNTDIFSNINAYNSSFTPKNGAGDYKLVWTISQAAPCSGTSSNSGSPLIITVYTPSSATGMTAHASSTSICAAGTVHLTQTGGTLGTGAHFEWSTDANFTAGFTVGTSTASDAALDVIVTSNTTYYVRIVGGTAPCSTGNLPATAPYPSVTVATTVNIWTGLAALSGGSSTDWFDANNWCGGVPDKNTSILIPLVAPGFPIIPDLSHGIAYVKDIDLAGATASITVSGTAVLNLHGAINTPLGGIVDFTDGTLGLAGTAQQISGSTFIDRTIKNLVDSTSASLTAVHDDTLNITGMFSFGNISGDPAATFSTNDNLTLKSSAAGTASVADITNNGATPSNSITGLANVERYIQAGRKWRFLAVNTTTGTLTVQNSWMESQTPGQNTGAAGYGMWVTGIAPATGFDAASPGATIKWWDNSTNTYIPITDPTAYDIRSHSAYMTFVRGDRSATGSGAGASVLTSTVLRTKGELAQGTTAPISVIAGIKYTPIGNPYAAAIDLTKLSYSTSNVINIAVWDPQLGSYYTLGAFQTLTSNGPGQPFTISPGGGSYSSVPFAQVNSIESGQGFLMQGTGSVRTLSFVETAKTTGNTNYPFFIPGQEQVLQAQFGIKAANGVVTLVDGAQVRFNTTYNTSADPDDARKMVNTSENISVKRGTELMAVEYRGVPDETDTVQLNIANLRAANYQWKMSMINMDQPGRTAFLIDRYLNTETALTLTGTTTYDFPVVNIAGSYAVDRFLVVFRPAAVVPVTLTSISATRLADKTVIVKWHAENEIGINHYELQRSGNGTQFISIASDQSPTNNAGGSAGYSKIDLAPLNGDNYYRIKAISNNGRVQYSAIVKVDPIVKEASISIYPNPITDRVMNLKFANQTAGKYQLQLSDKAGRVVYTSTVTITDGNEVKSLNIGDGLRSGGYDLVIIGVDGKRKVIAVVLE